MEKVLKYLQTAPQFSKPGPTIRKRAAVFANHAPLVGNHASLRKPRPLSVNRAHCSPTELHDCKPRPGIRKPRLTTRNRAPTFAIRGPNSQSVPRYSLPEPHRSQTTPYSLQTARQHSQSEPRFCQTAPHCSQTAPRYSLTAPPPGSLPRSITGPGLFLAPPAAENPRSLGQSLNEEPI